MTVIKGLISMHSAVADLDRARAWGLALEKREADRTSRCLQVVRRVVARRTGGQGDLRGTSGARQTASG